MKILDKKKRRVYEISVMAMEEDKLNNRWILVGLTTFGSRVQIDTFETEEESINVFNNLTNNIHFDYITQGGN